MLVVTNEYRALASGPTPAGGALADTASSRFVAATDLARHLAPRTPSACFELLEDLRVKMGMTAQHMVFRASTGEVEVREPADPSAVAMRPAAR